MHSSSSRSIKMKKTMEERERIEFTVDKTMLLLLLFLLLTEVAISPIAAATAASTSPPAAVAGTCKAEVDRRYTGSRVDE